MGPEVAVRALAQIGCAAALVGSRAAIEPWCERLQVDVPVIEPDGPGPIEVRSLEWVAERGGPLVTGPIHKGKLAAAGWTHRGHTDWLGARYGVDPVMAFVGGRVRVALVTVHIPLSQVSTDLTSAKVEHTVRTAWAALQTSLGLPNPRIVVCGLNPHAGDGGLMGREEIEIIAPAVERCRASGIDAQGPLSAEAAFLPGQGGDMVIAMYHDQGLVPLKALDFGRTVNWTLGVPIVRTSVDHGTAYALVGTDRVRAESMVAAVEWALQVSSSMLPTV